VSDSKPDVGPGDPLYYAPRWVRERNDQKNRGAAQHETDHTGGQAPDVKVTDLRRVSGRDQQNQKQPDVFAEAVARAERQLREPVRVEVPPYLQDRRPSIGIAAKFAVAVSVAILIAISYVVAFPTSQGPAEDRAWSGLPTWQSLKSSLFPAPHRRPPSTLIVRDNSGTINEPLGLGVSVEAPAPGASVTIKRMPADARLTAGRRMSANEWRVPVQDISDAAIIPPTDFVGELKLSAELHSSDGAALVTAFVRLIWTSTPAAGTLAASAGTATAPPGPVAPVQQQPQAMAAPPAAVTVTAPAATALALTTPAVTPPAVTAPALPTPQARAEPTQELSPNEIAALVRRAQELLASGDLQDARTLLTRAAEAHDARAALLLAKTFDPMTSRQLGAADQGPDLAQARNWYQRAREWGSPEAQRQLDALASYPRR
jgi:hypothetical protein